MINENEDRTTKVNAADTQCNLIVLPKYVDILISQSHIEYRKSWTNHVDQQDPHSLAKYLETHNAYVGQIHNVNGMIDYYYEDCLPHLLQEFDDVYHDVADVVLDSMSEGSKKITEKVHFHFKTSKLSSFCYTTNFVLDGKYDRKVAKNLRSCQDNFCWKGPYQDISSAARSRDCN